MPPYLQQDMSYLCNAVCIISIQHGEHNWWLTRNMFGIEHPSLVLTLSTKGKEAFVSHLLALVPALVSCLCREKILPVQRLLAALKSDSLRSPALFSFENGANVWTSRISGSSWWKIITFDWNWGLHQLPLPILNVTIKSHKACWPWAWPWCKWCLIGHHQHHRHRNHHDYHHQYKSSPKCDISVSKLFHSIPSSITTAATLTVMQVVA